MSFPADNQEWDDVVCSAYPLRKHVIENNNIKIKLFSPDKRPTYFTNAPYLEEGGILFNGNSENNDIGKEISSLFEQYNLDYILLKTRHNLVFETLTKLEIDDAYYTFLLDTTVGLDEIWKNKLKSKTRNQIRKAENNNYQIKIGHAELLDYFYTVISRCWRDLGTPIHSRHFFKLLLEKFGERACIVVVLDKTTPISAAFLFNIDGVLSHPYAGTINTYKPSSANNLMYWNIIKYASNMGIKSFDMGRSRLNQGTYNFKKSWGGEAKKINYYYVLRDGVVRPSYDSLYYRFATTMWKFIPLALANQLGPKLIYKVL